MEAGDKGDSGQFNKDDILNPKDWVLLNFIMDSRTGIEHNKNFKISGLYFMEEIISHCRNMKIDSILKQESVKERIDYYFESSKKAKEQIRRCTTVNNNLGILDLREEENIFPANRFLIYALFPEINISMHVIWGLNKLKTVFAIGKSVLNRTSKINIGNLMLEYGGGGHKNAGTCQVDPSESDEVKKELTIQLNKEE